MRINPITTYTYQNRLFNTTPKHRAALITTPDNTLDLNNLNQNYNQTIISRKNINFTSIKEPAKEFIQLIPIEERLGSLFEAFKTGDLIITGKSIKGLKKYLLESSDLIKNIIKRTFFVEDKNIKGNLAFIKNTENDIEVININPFDINLTSGNKTYVLPKQESFYVLPEDILTIDNQEIKIITQPKTDLSHFRKFFAEPYDFTTEVVPEINKLNKKTISKLSKDDKKHSSRVTFAEVGGQDDLIKELKRSVIYPIKFPKGYENIEVNKGIILYGPPGTGKTHIARALANEADANFVMLNGLDLESKWVGESEENWRKLFEEAKVKQPTIIFIDEFDAVARSRSSYDEYGNKVVNQILTLMTDIDNENDNVFVIGATNNFKTLDTAITRSGRFGKHLEVGLPDLDGVKKIFDIHSANKKIDETVSKENLAQKLYDMKASGADIRFIINEAHSIGYERADIYNKMENGTLKDIDIESFAINNDDFQKAIDMFINSKNSATHKPIGYK